MVIVLAMIVMIILLMGTVLLSFPLRSVDYSHIELDRTGVHAGDYFVYNVNGTYNDMPVGGSIRYNVTQGPSIETVSNLSDEELSSMLGDHSSLNPFGAGTEVGTDRFATPFGVKDVVWLFSMNGGWATVSFVGTNPGVAYGFAVNGANVHLSLTLTQTSNQWTLANNTKLLLLQPKPTNTDEITLAGIGSSPSWIPIYTEKGAHMNYSVNGSDVDVIGFSEGNIRSMAEGGPFAYDLDLHRSHLGNATGELELPKGYYFIYLTSNDPVLDGSQGAFHWSITRF